MTTEFEFALSLNTDAPLDVEFIRLTLKNVEDLLRDLERSITPTRRSVAKWRWGEEAHLAFVASVDGAKPDTLERVVGLAQAGFEQAMLAADSDGPVKWPPEFTRRARESAASVLRRLERLQSLTIQATGRPSLEITRARVDQDIVGRALSRMRSSVEGVLEMVSHRGTVLRAGLREVGTNRYVRCSLDADRWRDELRDRSLWDSRLTVYGLVAYDEEGFPVSVVDVDDIVERETGISLLEFEGAIPGLTQGLPSEEYLARLRGHE